MAVSDHALIDRGAVLGAGVSVGPFTVVHAGVELGAGTTVGSHCVLGHPGPDDGADAGPLRVGPGSTIRSHSVLYAGSTFGPRLETGHGVTLRERLVVGENLRVGTACDLQGDTRIGDYNRLHSDVFIPKWCTLGDFVWLFPHVVLTNDPHPPSDVQVGATIDDYAVIAARAVVLPGVRIGAGAVVSAGAVVTRDVAAGDLVVGAPARRVSAASEVTLRDRPGVPAYPWRGHFARGYPDAVLREWAAGAALPEAARA
jgi:acetyltransferase-like isoleucine patch superfamily enzyme